MSSLILKTPAWNDQIITTFVLFILFLSWWSLWSWCLNTIHFTGVFKDWIILFFSGIHAAFQVTVSSPVKVKENEGKFNLAFSGPFVCLSLIIIIEIYNWHWSDKNICGKIFFQYFNGHLFWLLFFTDATHLQFVCVSPMTFTKISFLFICFYSGTVFQNLSCLILINNTRTF